MIARALQTRGAAYATGRRAGQVGGAIPESIPAQAPSPAPLADGPCRDNGVAPPLAGLHGIFRVGASLLALHIDAIREVTPRPAVLARFPCRRDDVIGALQLRGSVIPIMDLARPLGLGASDGQVILVLRTGGGVIGILIDEICGVIPLDARRLSPLQGEAGSSGGLVHAGFIHEETPGAVLDAGAIARLPDLVVTTDIPVDRSHNAEAGDPVLLFDCRDIPLGLPARAVEATVPRTRLGTPAAETPLWIGVLDHNGRRIPVVDTLRLLGLGSCDRPSETASVVLRMPDNRLIAIAIDDVCDMRRVRAQDILELQRFRLGERGMLSGLYRAERDHLLLDPEACCTDERLVALSMIEEEAACTASSAEQVALGQTEPFLIALLGDAICAVPLAQVEEIIPTPATRIGLDGSQFAQALIAHRGRGVPLVDLPSRLGLGVAGDARPFAILAENGGDHVGFLIDGLVAVERVALQRLAARSDNARVPDATVRLPDGRTCEVINLAAMIAAEREACIQAA